MTFNDRKHRWIKKWQLFLRKNENRPIKNGFVQNKAGYGESCFEVLEDASMLSERWDIIAGENIFLKKSSLMHLQKVNPCSQRYYINEKEDMIFVSYRLNLNIFTLRRGLDLKLPVTIIGIPCSVSYKGYGYIKTAEKQSAWLLTSSERQRSLADRSSKGSVKQASDRSEILEKGIGSLKGIKLVLNADDDLFFPQGHTLPQYILDIRWSSFEEYLGSMRSHYRYRMKKALSFGAALKAYILNTDAEKSIENEMYKLYEEVYENSKDKLEKLDIEFFRTFPSTIIAFYIEEGENKIPAGFIQIKDNAELIFMFAGLDHALNLKYDIYLNMLLYMIRYAIENGYKSIDLGQTTMDTKLKLGAVSAPKYMYLTADNPFLRPLMPLAVKLLSYNEKQKTVHVFKKGY